MFDTTYDVFTQTNGETLSPLQGDPLAGIEGLAAGKYACLVTAACSSDLADACAKLDIQHCTAGGDILDSITISVPVSDTRQVWVLYKVEAGETINVVPTRNITGIVSAALNYQPIG